MGNLFKVVGGITAVMFIYKIGYKFGYLDGYKEAINDRNPNSGV